MAAMWARITNYLSEGTPHYQLTTNNFPSCRGELSSTEKEIRLHQAEGFIF